MSKNFLPIILVLTGASLFLAFQSQGKTEDDNPKSRYARVLHNVGVMLEQGHYSPKKIDDNFSMTVWKKFIEQLDDDRNIFLQSDIDKFSKYKNRIDDEIHGAELESFYAINDVYLKRLEEASQLYKDILTKPFDFTKTEKVVLDPEKLNFTSNETDRKDVWRKRLKYLALSRFVDLQAEREKGATAKPDTSLKVKFVYKADTTLEREARESVKKQIERYFATKKTHETQDENFTVFVNTITGSMDPHTSYMPPVDKRAFDEQMSGTFFGIGARLKEDDGKIKIADLVSGGPAWKGGDLKIDDEIIKIGQGIAEPVDVTGYAVTDAVKLIRGAQRGSEVRLTVKRMDGTIKVIILKRDEIKLDDTFAKSAIINGDHKVGYIYLPEFYINFDNPEGAKCSDDVAKELEKLKAEHVEGIIIDLRGNGGGSLPEVVKMAGLFIEDGPICIVKGREEKPYQWKDKDKNIVYSGPLTVMVDEFSASASEIFAAAIQDYKRGVIIGSTSTYGKGTVQRSIPLNPETDNALFSGKKAEDLGSIKLTVQKFYRINGGATQLKGVTPDIILPDGLEYLKFREKDNPSALPWDEIEKADYKPWVSNSNNEMVVSNFKDELKKNTTFSKLKSDIDLLQKYSDREYSLNIVKYKEELKLMQATRHDMDSLSKLTIKAMKVSNIATDMATINAAKEKVKTNADWLKRISNDIYIDESVKVLYNMINQSNTAKTN